MALASIIYDLITRESPSARDKRELAQREKELEQTQRFQIQAEERHKQQQIIEEERLKNTHRAEIDVLKKKGVIPQDMDTETARILYRGNLSPSNIKQEAGALREYELNVPEREAWSKAMMQEGRQKTEDIYSKGGGYEKAGKLELANQEDALNKAELQRIEDEASLKEKDRIADKTRKSIISKQFEASHDMTPSQFLHSPRSPIISDTGVGVMDNPFYESPLDRQMKDAMSTGDQNGFLEQNAAQHGFQRVSEVPIAGRPAQGAAPKHTFPAPQPTRAPVFQLGNAAPLNLIDYGNKAMTGGILMPQEKAAYEQLFGKTQVPMNKQPEPKGEPITKEELDEYLRKSFINNYMNQHNIWSR